MFVVKWANVWGYQLDSIEKNPKNSESKYQINLNFRNLSTNNVNPLLWNYRKLGTIEVLLQALKFTFFNRFSCFLLTSASIFYYQVQSLSVCYSFPLSVFLSFCCNIHTNFKLIKSGNFIGFASTLIITWSVSLSPSVLLSCVIFLV